MKNKLKYIIPSCVFIIAISSVLIFKNNENNNAKENNNSEIKSLNNNKNNYTFDNHQIVFGKTVDDSSSLKELETNSEIVVIATKLNSEKNKIIESQDGRIDDGYTLSQVKIKQVLENSTGSDIPETINIYENEFHDSENKITYHTNAYEKMEVNNEYLLFLRKSETDPFYLITGINAGKIPLSEEDNILQTKLKSTNTEHSKEFLENIKSIEKIQKEALNEFNIK